MNEEYLEVFESEFGIEEDDKARMELVGLVQKADFINKNKRFYPKEVLSAAVNRIRPKLKQIFSQLDHPDMKGRLRDTSHLIKDLYWDENDLYAKITVLDTPAGKVLREIVRAGGRPGLSSRGNGRSTKVSINGQEIERISPGFDITGIDFVTNPSIADAGVKQVIREAHEDETLTRIRQRMQKLAGISITETVGSRLSEQEYTCECMKCGHRQKSDEHCRDIVCEKCSGAMRRIERPGPGFVSPSMKPREQGTGYRCTCVDCGFTFTSRWERCEDQDCPKCQGPLKSAAATGKQSEARMPLKEDGMELLRNIARIKEIEVDEEYGIDWTEGDPHILLDDIALLTDTEEALDIARESFHDTEHESVIESVYRKAQSFAEIDRLSPTEVRDSLTERIHIRLQHQGGLDTRYFKESTKESQALERRLRHAIQEKRRDSVGTFIKIMEWAKK